MQYAQRSTPGGIVIQVVDVIHVWGYAWFYGPTLSLYVNSTYVLSTRLQVGDTIWSIIMAILSDPGHVIIAIISAAATILIYRTAPTIAVSQNLKAKVELLEREIATMKTREAAMIQYNKDLLARVIAAEQELILLNDISANNSRRMMSIAATPSPERVMVAIVGSDNSLNEDLTAFRAVEARTGLRYAPLKNATREKIESYLERWRLQRRPVRFAHIAGHMGKDGIVDNSKTITDIIDPIWLSGQIRDMEILVLAGCNSDRIGDLLRSVKTVVTLREDVETHDAAIFTEAFWHEIGSGAIPEDAYWAALDRCPTHVREHAEIHL